MTYIRLVVWALTAGGTLALGFAFKPQTKEQRELEGFSSYHLLRYDRRLFWIGIVCLVLAPTVDFVGFLVMKLW